MLAPAPVIPVELPKVEIEYMPIDGGLLTVVRQVKNSLKAFPVFEIARLFLDKPERQDVRFKSADPALDLYQDIVSGIIFTRENDLVAYILKHRIEEYYQIQRSQGEAPKGNFVGVAKCTLGGELIAPPNHHSFQARLKELYLSKYSKRMSFDQFRIKTEVLKDEETLAKWKDQESWKTEYQPKDRPDSEKLGSLEDVERDFRQHVLPVVMRKQQEFVISGVATRALTDKGLRQIAYQAWEQEMKFPIKFVNSIRPVLTHHGLHIFKNRKNVTVVNGVKSKYFDIDMSTVSAIVSGIISAVREQPGIKAKAMIQKIPFTPPEKNEALAQAATGYFDPFEGLRANVKLQQSASDYFLPQKKNPLQSRTAQLHHENAVLADLLWLVHEGYVVEFFDGTLEIGKKNPPQPQPEKKESDTANPPKVSSDPIVAAEPAPPQTSTLPPETHIDQTAGVDEEVVGANASTPDSPDKNVDAEKSTPAN